MARQGRLLATVVFVLLSGSAWSQQAPALQPVPATWVSGQSLIVQEENFTALSPGGSWTWNLLPSPPPPISRLLACVDSETGRRVLISVMANAKSVPVDDKFMPGFVAGMTKSAARNNWTLGPVEQLVTDFPRPGTRKVTTQVSSGDAPARVWVTYVVPGGDRLFTIQSLEVIEPAEHLAIAKSFRLLAEPPPPPIRLEPIKGAPTFAYIFLLMICLLIAAIVNRVKDDLVLNGARGALIIILILMVLRMALVLLISMRGADGAYETGEGVGRALGEALIPAAIAGYLDRRFQEKREAARRAVIARPYASRPATRPPITHR